MNAKFAGHDVLLRVAIGFAFLYPAIDGFIEPNVWLGYFPQFLLAAAAPILAATTLLHIWCVVEIIIASWILWGRNIFLPLLAAALALLGIVAFNIPLMQIVFRDLALALVAVTLAMHNLRQRI